MKLVVGSGYENFAKFLETMDESNIISTDSVTIYSITSQPVAAYVRNFRTYGSTEACTNNVGSFVCSSSEEEYMAIGYGGHSTSGSDYMTEFTVITKDEYTCHDSAIPNLSPGRYAPAIAAIGSSLFVCGGHYYGASTPRANCHKLDLEQYAPSWQSF